MMIEESGGDIEDIKMSIKPRWRNDASRSTPNAFRLTPHGFTLREVIVILAVISILVGILTPTVLKFIEEAQEDRAQEDVKVINAQLNDLIKDTGQFPGNKL
ncbi:MAG: type II secretion system protein, partial [Candidatus Binatia bacterium]